MNNSTGTNINCPSSLTAVTTKLKIAILTAGSRKFVLTNFLAQLVPN